MVYTQTRAQQLLRWATVWPQQTWAEKWGGAAVPVSMGGAGSPSNTMSPGLRPTSVPSGIWIRPAIGHNTPTLQDTQTIGQTVLQMVAQKLCKLCLSLHCIHD